MPPGSPSDIRSYFSPPRGGRLHSDRDQQQRGTPHAHVVPPTGHNQQQQQLRTPNRRRIITSDDDQPIAAENGQAAAEVPNAEHQRHDAVDPAIVIESSQDDDPDDIWVRPRLSTPQHQHDKQPTPILPLTATAQQQQHQTPPRNRRRQQPQPQQTTPRQRRRLEAAAVESAASDDDSSECVESDTNAQDLYRAAIRGVRNARQARQQNRSVTEHCPVCSKFATFLAHFM
jgi:hypothetical protein